MNPTAKVAKKSRNRYNASNFFPKINILPGAAPSASNSFGFHKYFTNFVSTNQRFFMKHCAIFFLLLASLLQVSCSYTSYNYQLCQIKGSLPENAVGSFIDSNEDCTIEYDFWCANGNPGFKFTNKTDSLIYIDLSKTFFIKNGYAFNYFLNRTTSTTSSKTTQATTQASKSVYGYFANYLTYAPGKISVAGAITDAVGISNSISILESEVIIIPPHASKVISEYNIMSDAYADCDFLSDVKKKKPESVEFELINSPIVFSNYITYQVGVSGKPHSTSNQFYVAKITNYHPDDFLESQESGCDNDYIKERIHVFKYGRPNSFYNKYEPIERKKSSQKALLERKSKSIDGIYD